MDDKTQLNVKISKGLAEKVRVDACKSGRALGDVAEIILGDFFKAWTWTEREKFYSQKPNKPTGRKICIRKKLAPALKEIGLEKTGQ